MQHANTRPVAQTPIVRHALTDIQYTPHSQIDTTLVPRALLRVPDALADLLLELFGVFSPKLAGFDVGG